jgi:hypothetical protein
MSEHRLCHRKTMLRCCGTMLDYWCCTCGTIFAESCGQSVSSQFAQHRAEVDAAEAIERAFKKAGEA